jgi:hypothetical protein
LKPIVERIRQAVCRKSTVLADADRDLFAKVAYLARDDEGKAWLEGALERFREMRPRKAVGCFLSILAYRLCELETGKYPKTREAKIDARHRFGKVLRSIRVPRAKREPSETPAEDADHEDGCAGPRTPEQIADSQATCRDIVESLKRLKAQKATAEVEPA